MCWYMGLDDGTIRVYWDRLSEVSYDSEQPGIAVDGISYGDDGTAVCTIRIPADLNAQHARLRCPARFRVGRPGKDSEPGTFVFARFEHTTFFYDEQGRNSVAHPPSPAPECS